MGGTKIVVLQLKEILKTVGFALAGLALILLLIYFFVPKEKSSETSLDLYIPGTYTTAIMVQDGPINVDVIVSNNEILSVGLSGVTEAQNTIYPLLSPAMEQVSRDVVRAQGTNIEVPDEYSVTGSTLLAAVRSALAQAVIAP